MKGFNIERVKTMVGKYTDDIAVATDSLKKNCYVILFRNKIHARIFKMSDTWYIWYERLNCREKVANFTTALKQLEKELLCVE